MRGKQGENEMTKRTSKTNRKQRGKQKKSDSKKTNIAYKKVFNKEYKEEDGIEAVALYSDIKQQDDVVKVLNDVALALRKAVLKLREETKT